MLSSIPAFLRGCLSASVLAINTLVMSIPLLAFSLSRFLMPIKPWQKLCTRLCIAIAECWISINSGWMKLTRRMQWQIAGLDSLQKDEWYLVTCNHQSWADIFIVQHLLNRRIPMLKFFLKQELIWVPVIGLCWWALDFPFMKRYSRAYLEKHPEKRGEDLKATRKACEKFRDVPVSVFNFIEGTRFTDAKHKQQKSSFQYLLKPRAGGVGFVLGAMDQQLRTLINITIVYQDGVPSFWDFLCGRGDAINVRIEKQTISDAYLGRDYSNDEVFREQCQNWVNELWTEKDQLILSVKENHARAVAVEHE
ncbi:acyltransferase [Endozoicomonas sp. GU-1]|uniref:acyltransferase n=1 Tax=Endozoicomonas sp. GU-1 TaxID=3009078 RepID=UPI0022B3AB68|nr:acyltransferase [Endozoicomonas sp. GU-1]WBA82016.1 acyltransferase [Endozoicomonas sp. GU-1]WBA84962.1 acyltransferase [Endozoicomonas sp. GU-1]